jgi:Tol biopolymer transport system component
MALAPGTRLGAFEVGALLGVGGMGEVYRATDTSLKRHVAIKVLPTSFAGDARRVARFQREAEILASLNHPNIAHIHGLEKWDGAIALVMEFVDGPTLADRIATSAIPLDEALAIARQIADALESAHEQGIIHRDLKPANIKVCEDGRVKVLDFGLAKALESGNQDRESAVDDSRSPTVMAPTVTGVGTILGTAAYMAPEQARGRPVNRRADVWAFGIVLYEMLAGRRAFDGDDHSSTLASVLKDEVDWDTLPGNLPDSIHRLLRRCLEKDPRRRLSAMGDARLELDDVAGRPHDGNATVQDAAARRRVAPLMVASVAGTALLAALSTWALTRPGPPPGRPVIRSTIALPAAMPLTTSLQASTRVFAAAPDGSFLVYRSGTGGQLVMRRFDRLEPAPLPGITDVLDLAISPDSQWIAYVEGSSLRKVAVAGGTPVTIARLGEPARGLAWTDDDVLIVGTSHPSVGLRRVPSGGGDLTPLTAPDAARGELGHVLPSSLPGGRTVLFTVASSRPEDSSIELLDLESGARTTLLKAGRDAQYVASGHLAYATGGGVSAVALDLGRRAVVGNPVRVIERVGAAATGALNAAVTRAGMLVYVSEDVGDDAPRVLVWIDRQGRETPLPAPPRAYVTARLSPDETRAAVAIRDREQDIWIWDFARQTLTRLTSDPAGDLAPVWTPDGRRVVFASTRTGVYNLYAQAADGTGTAVRLTAGGNTQAPDAVTPDGAFVIGREVRPATKADIVRFAMDGDLAAAPDALVETRFDEWNADISPDGRFIAYQSNESGRPEVYVQRYPRPADGRWQVSLSGGSQPQWTRDGRELIYVDEGGRMSSVAFAARGSTVEVGRPVTLFTTRDASQGGNAFRGYDVSRDGQRFLMIKDADERSSSPALVVVQNWVEELTRLLPAR